jgi:drug/metabolite transporter (DMT)-like permease
MSAPHAPGKDALLLALLFFLGAPFLFNLVDAASFIAPLSYCHIAMVTVCGWLFFGRFPDGGTLAGIAAIVASGAAIAAHETRREGRPAPVQRSRREGDHG